MDEKILAQSQRCNIKVVFAVICLIGLLFGIVLSAALYGSEIQECRKELNYYEKKYEESRYGMWKYNIEEAEDKLEDAMEPAIIVTAVCFLGVAIAMGLVCLGWSKTELVVSDKRVFGKAALGTRVDLPLDSISAITTQWPKGISVATSSGKIVFLLIKNRDALHSTISKLLIDRQAKSQAARTAPAAAATPALSNADELKKYKELLDMGAITQEEFDAKKNQLLGL